MTTQGRYIFIASMDVDPDREDLFNRVYDQEHMPNLAKVPGVLSVARFERVSLTMALGGRIENVPPAHPKYHAIYEIDDPKVLISNAWADAVEQGQWPSEVRPFTKHREHLLTRRLGA